MNHKKTVGQLGEEIASNALEKEGYRILEKNFSCKQGELDIIAEDKGVICFVEVKARTSEDYGLPEEAVTYWKKRKLLIVAHVYVEKKKIKERDMRFDIVSVNLNTHETRILKNAFEVEY